MCFGSGATNKRTATPAVCDCFFARLGQGFSFASASSPPSVVTSLRAVRNEETISGFRFSAIPTISGTFAHFEMSRPFDSLRAISNVRAECAGGLGAGCAVMPCAPPPSPRNARRSPADCISRWFFAFFHDTAPLAHSHVINFLYGLI